MIDSLIGSLGTKLNRLARSACGPQVEERLRRAAPSLNEFGVDPFGFSIDFVRQILGPLLWLYRRYFRTETFGLENLPAGRVLLVANHSGQVPIDAGMIAVATLMDAPRPRALRGMTEKWIPTLPFASIVMSRSGMVVGTPQNCRRLLDAGEAIMVFPEGVRGITKPWSQRYQLQPFGHGFMRLAIETDTPIVPVAVVGGEEQMPSLADLKPLARLLGMPAFPLIASPVVLPSRYRLYFGEPMRFHSFSDDEQLGRHVEVVRSRVQAMLREGLRRRRHIFW
ncbi:MAG: acyltransferase family protein [Myxococcales bacterium]|nr:acyltransferase family protein [Myxococcales bacterium]